MTQIFNAITQKENGARLSGSVIRNGGLVAFPTETVYGLGANGLDGAAVQRIFEVKGRPNDNPLILHVAKKSDVKALWHDIPEKARILMDTFWPGPLTIVYNKSSVVPDEVTAGLPTVAVRMPDHRCALALIREAGVPIAAPSANLSGKPSPTTAEHVKDDLWGKIDVILDGGPCRVGLESTVLSLVGTPAILRPGGVTKEMLEAVIGEVAVANAVLHPLGANEKAASPGMKYKHYAPDAQVIIGMHPNPRAAAGLIAREYDVRESRGERCVIFASKQTEPFYRGRTCVIIGDRKDPSTMCAALFSSLRAYSGKADVILTESLPETDMGLAYMNRLLRAAGFETIEE
ncbi:MAG: L-threonylcarbamoyladenylate synthase [Eubacteriales bacterium]|nr:L-threonylcarbamoyladenylate synthase [Eubacteriales bacterium]